MSHFLKIVMDGIFGEKNFQNEIIWHYNTGGASKRHFSKKHDVIFSFAKDLRKQVFNPQKEPYREGSTDHFTNVDSDGRKYRIRELHGKEYVYYLDEGRNCHDVWEIDSVNAVAKERMGYPTQKPLKLLDRIIKAASNSGDLVLDPFCGCGTTVTAAENLNRRWIGIDVCHRAYKIIEKRLNSKFKFIDIDFVGMPKTIGSARDLARRDKFKFELWAASIVDGIEANKKQRGDKGIDGKGRIAIAKGKFVDLVSQVKGGYTSPGDVQAFNGARQQAGADMGIFTCFENKVTQGMRDAAASTGKFMGAPVVQIYTVDDWFNGKKPEFPDLRRAA